MKIKSIILILCLAVILTYISGKLCFSLAQDQAMPDPQAAPDAALPTVERPADMPVDAAAESKKEEFVTTAEQGDLKDQKIIINSEKISLDLKGIDIVELLRILSLKTGLTLVPTKSVGGRVNIFLNNLTFDDALDVILISQDLACDKKGNIINIMTSGEYEKMYGRKYNEKRKTKVIKLAYAKPSTVFTALGQVKSDIGKIIADEASGTLLLIDIPEKLDEMEELVKDIDKPLDTAVFDLKYAKSADMKAHLSTAVTSGTGEIFVDERSGKVVVTDLPEKMKKIKRMVKAFDAESQEVFIEAEILQITLKDEFMEGVNWEKLFKGLNNFDLKGTFPVSPSFTPSPAFTTASMLMTVGTIAANKYTATVQFLQSLGDTKILSRPRIAAMNNQEAKIMVGSREAYITSTLSQAQSTTVTSESIQFVDVGVKLNVVPTINADGFVTMKIKPEVSSVRETITSALGSKIPIVETSEAETVVKVRDGSMIMIAGLMKEEKRKESEGIPGLKNMPVIGRLFRGESKQKKKTELVVFITPHIISGDANYSGTEIKDVFPADIVPKDAGDRMIADEVGKIKIEQEPQANVAASSVSGKSTSVQENPLPSDIQKKAKGLKKY